MAHNKTKWLIATVRILGAIGVVSILTVRAVYGADSSPLPDGLTGPALIAAALLYMAKTIYELAIRRKEDDPRTENGSLWRLLTAHMEREERAMEALGKIMAEGTVSLKEFLIRQEVMSETVKGLADAQQHIAQSVTVIAHDHGELKEAILHLSDAQRLIASSVSSIVNSPQK